MKDGAKMSKKAIYPGTFDPLTNGHLDLIERASKLFDNIIVAIGNNPEKNPMFNVTERQKMIETATKHLPNVKTVIFHSLLVDLCTELSAKIIIRGVRTVTDFEYEMQMNHANVSLNREIETIFLMPSLETSYISSSVVRAILKFNGEINHLVPSSILKNIKGEK
jgi:pantetheine-phosphate adenylyltransferase